MSVRAVNSLLKRRPGLEVANCDFKKTTSSPMNRSIKSPGKRSRLPMTAGVELRTIEEELAK